MWVSWEAECDFSGASPRSAVSGFSLLELLAGNGLGLGWWVLSNCVAHFYILVILIIIKLISIIELLLFQTTCLLTASPPILSHLPKGGKKMN